MSSLVRKASIVISAYGSTKALKSLLTTVDDIHPA